MKLKAIVAALTATCAAEVIAGGILTLRYVAEGAYKAAAVQFVGYLISLVGACVTRVIWIYTVFAAVPTLQVLYSCYPVSWLFTILMQIVAFFVIRHNLQKRLSTPLAHS